MSMSHRCLHKDCKCQVRADPCHPCGCRYDIALFVTQENPYCPRYSEKSVPFHISVKTFLDPGTQVPYSAVLECLSCPSEFTRCLWQRNPDEYCPGVRVYSKTEHQLLIGIDSALDEAKRRIKKMRQQSARLPYNQEVYLY